MQIEKLVERRTIITTDLDALQQTGDLADEFSGSLLNTTVDVVTVQPGGTLVFRFKDGEEVVWS